MSRLQRLKSAADVCGSLGVILVAGILIWKQFQPSSPIAKEPPIHDVQNVRLAATDVKNAIGSGRTALVEFADYECPFCGRHARDIYPLVKEQLIDAGRLRYVFMNYPLTEIHPQAFKASEAAECAADQDRFWSMHKLLFASATAMAHADLVAHADALGLDSGRFRKCLAGEKADKVLADMQRGRQLGVNGTPAFFFGRVAPDGSIELTKRIDGAVSYDALAKVVESISEGLRAGD